MHRIRYPLGLRLRLLCIWGSLYRSPDLLAAVSKELNEGKGGEGKEGAWEVKGNERRESGKE